MLALAVFIASAVALLAYSDQAMRSSERARDTRIASDIARSTLALIAVRAVTPESQAGPLRALEDGSPDPIPAPPGDWRIEIETDPSGFPGLTRVSVHARRYAEGTETVLAEAAATQIVRIEARRAREEPSP